MKIVRIIIAFSYQERFEPVYSNVFLNNRSRIQFYITKFVYTLNKNQIPEFEFQYFSKLLNEVACTVETCYPQRDSATSLSTLLYLRNWCVRKILDNAETVLM